MLKYDYSMSNNQAINRIREIQNCIPVRTRDDVKDIYALELAIGVLTQLVDRKLEKGR